MLQLLRTQPLVHALLAVSQRLVCKRDATNQHDTSSIFFDVRQRRKNENSLFLAKTFTRGEKKHLKA